MIRDSKGSDKYWSEWISFSEERIAKVKRIRGKEIPANPNYEPQYVLDLAWRHVRLLIQRYSRGDVITDLSQYIPGFLDAWEEAERLGADVWSEHEQHLRHSWKINLSFYIDCFWLIGLALSLRIPDDQWQRLLALVGNEGEDILLDKVIASRQKDRRIGEALCHTKPYGRLLGAIDAKQSGQARGLFDFVDHWYAELNRKTYDERPSWYTYGDDNFEGGAYFGRWCIEAVAAVKAFNMDDSLCLGHPNYPGDLLRPDAPTTHRRASHASNLHEVTPVPASRAKRGFFTRWMGRQ